MKAVIYNRVSTKQQDETLQLSECQQFIQEKGWELDKVFSEKASAFKDDSQRPVFNEMLEYCKTNKASAIVGWNMDRFSRQPAEKVLDLVKMLSLMHNIQVVAVHGDIWADLVGTIGKLNEMGFVGSAIAEFMEKLIRGIEFHRAFSESQVKSERVKLAIKHPEGGDGKPYSVYGNKWGRPTKLVDEKRILELRQQGYSYGKIAETLGYTKSKVFFTVRRLETLSKKQDNLTATGTQ